jgi:hypothetical protein
LPDPKQDPDPESESKTSLKVGSGVGSETNPSGSTTLIITKHYLQIYGTKLSLVSRNFLYKTIDGFVPQPGAEDATAR